MRIAVLNGPNLNLLGTREPEVYGTTSLAEIEARLHDVAGELGVGLAFAQFNHEGDMIDAIHALGGRPAAPGVAPALRERADAALVNAGAWTHTSLALRDALAGVSLPYVEVHLSNIFAREPERRQSMLASGARAVLCGFGAHGYELALRGSPSLRRCTRHGREPPEKRLAALRASLAVAQLDALLVTSLPNIRYLTGFSGSNALLVVASGDAVLLTDFRYYGTGEGGGRRRRAGGDRGPSRSGHDSGRRFRTWVPSTPSASSRRT